MTGKISNREFSRAMINTLKKMDRDKGELRKVLRKKFPDPILLSDEGLRKRVERYLPKFEDLDFIELRGGKYCWKNEFFKGFGDDEEEKAHSRMLIPALRRIAGIIEPRYAMEQQAEYISEEDMRIFVSCAEEHLRRCKDAWTLIEKYRKIYLEFIDMETVFEIKLMEKLKKAFNEPIISPLKSSKHHRFIGDNIPSLIHNHILVNLPSPKKNHILVRSKKHVRVTLDGAKICFGGNLIARGAYLFNRVSGFVNRESEDASNIETVTETLNTLKESIEMKPLIEYEIRKIIIRIKTGYCLPGECKICESDP